MTSALVITPTIGSPELLQAINSVQQQTYGAVHHLLVVDGQQYSEKVSQVLDNVADRHRPISRCDLPFNTGGGGWYGHRIMAGFSHLTADFDYVLFLDQDNWFAPDHVESLVTLIQERQFHWAHSLRQIWSKDGQYVCDDRCESLGRRPVYWTQSLRLIDSSSYCFTNAFIREVGHHWEYGWGADRVFYEYLWKRYQHENYGCTDKHTLCYRLGGSKDSVQAWMFLEGNKPEHERHPELLAFIDRVKKEQNLL
jgi:glycosyltransferase involved in cell wall biosynthesis